MGTLPAVVLKASLWTQAALLLVLTSILADTDAWIGTILTTAGLCFVIIGILAAYMQRFGYLYIYATLVGIWEISALAHILLICGLASLPPAVVDVTNLVGNRVSSDPSDPLRIVLPLLYGIQWIFWCISLISLISLRPEALDPTHGFDIQESSREYTRLAAATPYHSQYRHHCSKGRNTTVINIPHGRGPPSTTLQFEDSSGEDDKVSSTTNMKGKAPADHQYFTNNTSGMRPEWPNSGTIVIPKDPRISQVLVRLNHSGSRATPIHRLENPHPYAQDATYLPGMTNPVNQQHRPIQQHNQPAIFKEGLDEVTVTPADIQSLQGPSNRHPEPKQPSNHAHFVLNVPSQGESLSEMILKVSEPGQTPLMHNPTSTARPVHNTSTLNDEALTSNARNTRNGAPSLPTDTPNPARVKSTATKASLTLSSDSSLSGLSAISNESSFECDEAEHTVTSAENTSFSTNQKAQRRNFGVSPLAILSEPEIEHYEAFMPQTEPHEPSYIFQRPNEVTRSRREAMTQAPLWKTNTKNRSDDVQELAPKSVLSSMGETMSSEVNSMSEPCPRIQPNSSYLGQAIPASTTASTMSVNSRALQDPEEAAIAFTMETNEPSHPPATISIQYLTITPSTSPVTSTPNSSAAKSGSELTSTLDTPASVAYTPTASTFTASTAPFPTPALSTPIPTPVPPPFYGRTPVIAHLQQIGAFDAFPERSYTPASSSTNRASHRHDSKPNFNPPSPLQAYHQRLENDPYISHRMKGSFRVMSPSNTSAPFEFPLSPTATTAAPAPTSFSTSTSPLPLVSLPTPSVQVTEPEDDPLPLAITDNRQETNIPMIVIHPDPDDQKEGESPRVLSNEDIEYLSMMPPPPLRLLEQPWDDSFEDEEYMDDIEEEYSDEDHEHRIVRSRSVYDIEEEDTDREESDDDQTMLVSMEIDDQHRGIE